MNKKAVTIGLVMVILFQITVLAGEYLGAAYPLWTGKEIRLKTIPVDPRSLFRGNYARLNYDISTIEDRALSGRKKIRNGEVVYVKLKTDADGLSVFDGAGLEQPQEGVFIRGRIRGLRPLQKTMKYSVCYGIEAYFTPRKKALALERALRGGGIAVIKIAGNGRAALQEVIPNQSGKR